MTFSEIADLAGVRGPQIVMRDMQGEPSSSRILRPGRGMRATTRRNGTSSGTLWGSPPARRTGSSSSTTTTTVTSTFGSPTTATGCSSSGTTPRTEQSGLPGSRRRWDWQRSDRGWHSRWATTTGRRPRRLRHQRGPHVLRYPLKDDPAPVCEYHAQFEWGTCFHLLLHNDGTRDEFGNGTSARFVDVAPLTSVVLADGCPPRPWTRTMWTTTTTILRASLRTTSASGHLLRLRQRHRPGPVLARIDSQRGRDREDRYFPVPAACCEVTTAAPSRTSAVRAHLLDISRVNYEQPGWPCDLRGRPNGRQAPGGSTSRVTRTQGLGPR